MRRLAILTLATAVAVAACSGDDASDDDAPTPDETTPLTLPDVGDRCEDLIDPADYLDTEVPAAIRPCEIPTELRKQLVRPGTGRLAQPGDGVVFDFTTIRAADGALVESSWTIGRPGELPVIGRGGAPTSGLDDALIESQAGELFRLDVPADEAYGDDPPGGGDGVIQPGDALTYVIEVLAVIPLLTPEDAPLDLTVPTSEGAEEITTTDLEVGTGKVVEEGDTVVLAVLMARGDNLAIFYNSWDRRQPLVIPLAPDLMEGPQPITIPGIFEGIQGARVGSRRVITAPPSAAWGGEGQPMLGLPPDTDVIVIADVLGAY